MTYSTLENEYGQKIILRANDDGSVSSIPINEENSDYQAYLADEA